MLMLLNIFFFVSYARAYAHAITLLVTRMFEPIQGEHILVLAIEKHSSLFVCTHLTVQKAVLYIFGALLLQMVVLTAKIFNSYIATFLI